MLPEAAATIGATIGRSQAAVMVERAVWWTYMLMVNSQLISWEERLEDKIGGQNIHDEGEVETGKEG